MLAANHPSHPLHHLKTLSVLRVYQDIIAEDVIVGELLAPGGDNQVVTPAEMIT